MIRIQLDDTTRDELRDMRRQQLPARARDRVGMVLLADAGWPAARIAGHLGCSYRTALDLLNDFQARGPDALVPRRRGPAPDAARRDQVAGHLRELLEQDRTWTSAQLAEALKAHDITLSARRVRRHLRGIRSGYRRTSPTVEHRQDPAKAARATKVLGHLADRAGAGLVGLYWTSPPMAGAGLEA